MASVARTLVPRSPFHLVQLGILGPRAHRDHAHRGGAIVVILIAYPGIALPWRQIAGVLLTTPPFLFIAGGAQLLFPVRVEVRRDRIMISHGQSSLLLKPERIRRAEITTDDRGDWLDLEYTTTRGTPRTRRVLLSDRVDRPTLAELLADLTHAA